MNGKTIFLNENGDVHFGREAPEGFNAGSKEEVLKTLANLNGRKLWRCTVCNDLHIGNVPPHECPTCHQIDAYVEINEQELRKLMGL